MISQPKLDRGLNLTLNKVDEIINSVLIDISYYKNNNWVEAINSLQDTKFIQGMMFTGNQFQLCYSLTLLYEINKVFSNETLNQLGEKLFENVTLNTKKSFYNPFNYFSIRYIPDDLDTASMIIKVFSEDKLVKEFSEITGKNQNTLGFIRTWFIGSNYNQDYFHNTVIYKNDDFYHPDVMLSYLDSKQKIENSLDISLLRRIVKEYELSNYWYIPSFYSLELYLKLLVNNQRLVNSSDIYKASIILQEMKESYPSIRSYNSCTFEKIKFIAKTENSTNNWLCLSYLLSCIALYSELAFDKNEYLETSRRIIDDIHIQNDFEPSLYWSIGLQPFRSKLLSRLLFLRNICVYKKFITALK